MRGYRFGHIVGYVTRMTETSSITLYFIENVFFYQPMSCLCDTYDVTIFVSTVVSDASLT